MNENKLKEWLYAEQRKAIIYGELGRLNKINRIIYRLHCREQARKERLKSERREKYMERLVELKIKREVKGYDI